MQHDLAQWIELVYDSADGTDVTAAVQTRYPEMAGSWLPGTPLAPPAWIGISGHTVLVLSAGTDTIDQWIGQILNGLAVLVQYGLFETLPIWFDAANRIFDRLYDLAAPDDGQFVAAGHSYGGAVACILAARAKLYQEDRDVRLLTLGCPRPGGLNLQRVLDATVAIHLRCHGDPVPCVPPDPLSLAGVGYAVDLTQLRVWGGYDYARPAWNLEETGERTETQDCGTVLLRLALWAFYAAHGWSWGVPFPHLIANYVRLTVCPGEEPAPPPTPGELSWSGQAGMAVVATGENVTITPG